MCGLKYLLRSLLRTLCPLRRKLYCTFYTFCAGQCPCPAANFQVCIQYTNGMVFLRIEQHWLRFWEYDYIYILRWKGLMHFHVCTLILTLTWCKSALTPRWNILRHNFKLIHLNKIETGVIVMFWGYTIVHWYEVVIMTPFLSVAFD